MLLQIREFLCKEQVASDQQMARAFQMDVDALEPMLQKWVQKKVIKVHQKQFFCNSSCFKCQTKPPVYYEYCGKEDGE